MSYLDIQDEYTQECKEIHATRDATFFYRMMNNCPKELLEADRKLLNRLAEIGKIRREKTGETDAAGD